MVSFTTNNKKPMRIPYALSVYDEKEERAVLEVLRSHKTGIGERTEKFESMVAKMFGKKHGIMVNSGSSANLLAYEILRLKKGSQVVTPALTFSTTISPLLQKELKPVLIDVEEGTYLPSSNVVKDSINARTSALMIPNLLGNVPDMKKLQEIKSQHSIYYVEDSCDTLGATFSGKPTGTYSDISITSFYGSHIITAGGGGGMICVNNNTWDTKARILRGWGRSSAVDESEDIEKRFKVKLDGIPYDSKYLFKEVGYNFLPLEISSAFGIEQLKKLKYFSVRRNQNFSILNKFFSDYKDFFVLPKQLEETKTNWLAFPLTIKPKAPFSRADIVKYLEKQNVQTRPIFTGNVIRQPAFKGNLNIILKKDYPVADDITRNGFVLGCNQGLDDTHMTRLTNVLSSFLSRFG